MNGLNTLCTQAYVGVAVKMSITLWDLISGNCREKMWTGKCSWQRKIGEQSKPKTHLWHFQVTSFFFCVLVYFISFVFHLFRTESIGSQYHLTQILTVCYCSKITTYAFCDDEIPRRPLHVMVASLPTGDGTDKFYSKFKLMGDEEIIDFLNDEAIKKNGWFINWMYMFIEIL